MQRQNVLLLGTVILVGIGYFSYRWMLLGPSISLNKTENVCHIPFSAAIPFTVRDFPTTRIKLSLIKTLYPFYIAHPDTKEVPRYPGGSWYDAIWNEGSIRGFHTLEYICKVIQSWGCSDTKFLLQAGSHLGVYPFQGAAANCSAVAIDGYRNHIAFMNLTALVNGFQDRFTALHAIVGETPSSHQVRFRDSEVVNSNVSEAPLTDMVTLDDIDDKVLHHQEVLWLVVDVEGFEQHVLLGGRKLIKSGRVRVLEVEVWTKKDNRTRESFPGLDLLLESQYIIVYGHRTYPTVPPLVRDIQAACDRNPVFGNVMCLSDVFAVQPVHFETLMKAMDVKLKNTEAP